jgi:prepilin-type processing-associated H-X9-DG protein
MNIEEEIKNTNVKMTYKHNSHENSSNVLFLDLIKICIYDLLPLTATIIYNLNTLFFDILVIIKTEVIRMTFLFSVVFFSLY